VLFYSAGRLERVALSAVSLGHAVPRDAFAHCTDSCAGAVWEGEGGCERGGMALSI
jgi:hypothetical protein